MTRPSETTLPITLNGCPLAADWSGALLWPERGLLVVADLHLEKGSAFAEKGIPLPPWDTAQTIGRLSEVCRRLAPAAVVCLGDSFHDQGAAARVNAADGEAIRDLTRAFDWTWVVGNHDPAPPETWGGRVVDELVIGPLVLRHEAKPDAGPGEVSGHYHPKARIPTRAGRRSGRCFVHDGKRLVLPAFGAFTGGLDVYDPAIQALISAPFEVLFLGPSKLHRFPGSALSKSRAA